jgi:hypothetical protein
MVLVVTGLNMADIARLVSVNSLPQDNLSHLQKVVLNESQIFLKLSTGNQTFWISWIASQMPLTQWTANQS